MLTCGPASMSGALCLRWQHHEITDDAAVLRAGFRGGNRSSFGRDAMRLLARLVSGIFKNILDMIVKCILQRLGARARDSDICQC